MKKAITKSFKILILLFIYFLFFYISYNFIFQKYKNKVSLENSIKIFENQDNLPFFINKTLLYSSAYGKNKNTNFQESNWILDLYQYTDIAIYLDTYLENLSEKNSLKSIYLSNFKISNPVIGTPSLYYLDSFKFGTENYLEENLITDTLKFSVLNDSNSENIIKTNTPVLFSDLSNPITIKYVNKINSNFKLPTNEIILFDGNLLKKANISQNNLNSTISFKINLVSNENKKYFYNITIKIPLSNAYTDIYSGHILEKKENLNYTFLVETN